MIYGNAWYPEAWDESRWATDLSLMREAGMNMVRVAEFAWSRLEPAEGQYEMDWLVRAVDLAAKHDIKVVVGTPSAAPPAWMTQRYPDVLAVEESGRSAIHGGRCHYNPTSPRYIRFCVGVAEAMARALGNHPNVVGWQIDNEYWRVSFDGHTREQWHKHLKSRYGSLDQLNSAWANTYWSQEYSDWSQVPFSTGWQNPCLIMELRRFMTGVYVAFQQAQIEAVRKHAASRQWITHNLHAHEWLDWIEIAQGLDRVSYDPYIGTGHLDYRTFGWTSDMCRAIKPGVPFWIMETQPGRVNWHKINTDLDKGELRSLVYHLLGRGAEAVLFWQWRSALGGQEQYHGSFLHPDGSPRPLYAEAAQVGRELASLAPALDGAEAKGDLAILYSYPDRWSLLGQAHHQDYSPIGQMLQWYAPVRELGLTPDVQDPRFTPLGDVPLVLAPMLHVMPPGVEQQLVSFVKSGGHLVLGPRAGFKDERNALLPSRQPGDALRALAGACVEEYYALGEPVAISGAIGTGTAAVWAEILKPEAKDVRVLLRYGKSNGWLDGQPAALTRKVGLGQVTYMAASLDAKLMQKFIGWCVKQSAIALPLGPLPEGVEVSRLWKDSSPIYIVINHSAKVRRVSLPEPMLNLLGAKRAVRAVSLAPREVAVLAPIA